MGATHDPLTDLHQSLLFDRIFYVFVLRLSRQYPKKVFLFFSVLNFNCFVIVS